MVVRSGGNVDGASVEGEALGALVLGDDEGHVVHAVALAEELVVEGDQLGVVEDGLEEVRLPPREDVADVDAAPGRVGAGHARVGQRVADRRVQTLLHDLLKVRVDGIVGLLDLLL